MIFWIQTDVRSSWHLGYTFFSTSPGKGELHFRLESGIPDLARGASHCFLFSPFFFISSLHFAALVRQQEARGFLSRAFSRRDVLTASITVAGKERNTPTLQKAWPSCSLSVPSPRWPHFSLGGLAAPLGLYFLDQSSVQAQFYPHLNWIWPYSFPKPSS